MQTKIKRLVISGAIAGVMLTTAAADVLAQGRGRGRGGDDRAGKQSQNRQDRGDRRNKGNDRRERGNWQQQRSDQNARREQAESDRRSRMQQARSDQNSRRQQAESDRRSREQQRQSERNSRRQQYESDLRSRNAGFWQGFPQTQQRRVVRNDRRDRDDRRYRDAGRNRNGDQRARWNRVGNGTPPWANRNYQRPAQNRIRQEIRRQERDFRRYERNGRRNRNSIINVWPTQIIGNWGDGRRDRRYDRDGRRYRAERRDRWADRNRYPAPVYYYTPVVQQWFPVVSYSSPVYYDRYSYPRYSRSDRYYPVYDNGYYYGGNDYYYEDDRYYDRGDWKEGLLRSILSVVFGGGNGSYYYDQPVYASYNEPYYSQPYYSESGYKTIYSTPVYGQAYTAHNYYGYPYQTAGYGAPHGQYDPYSQDLIQRAAATGYCRGYMDAQNAQRYGWADQYDPYGYDNGAVFSNYSVSFTERQRLLSQGYELGYRDAMAERDYYGVEQNGGTLDLVSVLLENVLLNGTV